MPKVAQSTEEQSRNTMAEQSLTELLKNASVNIPTVVCGVNRKINTGNFENIDVFFAVSVPVMAFPTEDMEAFKEAVAAAAEEGFLLASKETGDRYSKIKDMQSS